MTRISYDNYTNAGDIAVIAICLVMTVLLVTSYVRNTRSYRIFLVIIATLAMAAVVHICYHALLQAEHVPVTAVYVLRLVYYVLLFGVFFLFALYTTVVSELDRRRAKFVAVFSASLFAAIVLADIVLSVTGYGFRISESGAVQHTSNVFMVGYVVFVAVLAALLLRIRNLVYKRVMYGFLGTMMISVGIRFVQMALHHSSLTTMTFVFPVLAMMYIMHANPYNVTVGTLDIRSMQDMVSDLYHRGEDFLFMSLYLPDFDGEGQILPEEIRAQIRRFSVEYFRSGVLFQIGGGQIVMLAKKSSNPDYEQWFLAILDAFQEQYRVFKLPFKLVYGESIEEISRKNEYISLIDRIHQQLADDTIHRVCADDVIRFRRSEYILQELEDIYRRHDLDDPRVLAYCQPVFNLQTGVFDSAEALMRLELDKTGLVSPMDFIPLAEENGYIHVLTEIIMHKTCREIRRMQDEGFRIHRISVNVSVLELKDEAFCEDVLRIIDSHGILSDRLAIELTETRTEADFVIMKRKIDQLHQQGIRFYLDDFGTGYSNMERIMELPFDIIKFDRSLVIASGTSERSGKMVENLAHLFREMDYDVLYEGVESEADERLCRDMSAAYLQGYKYSRPIPISQLRSFLTK